MYIYLKNQSYRNQMKENRRLPLYSPPFIISSNVYVCILVRFDA